MQITESIAVQPATGQVTEPPTGSRGPAGDGPPEHTEVAVIGGGAAGLTVARRLTEAGIQPLVLERAARVGDVWRERYDSLRLFSTPRYSSLPGMRMRLDSPPTRTQMADYLEGYAAETGLRVRTGVLVEEVTRHGSGFLVRTSRGDLTADQVVVATGAHQRPVTPALAAELDPALVQLHSLDYRHPGQLAPGGVLVVGAANSGTDIALDAAAAGHQVWLSGRHPGQVPVDIDARSSRPITPVVMFVQRHVLTLRTPMGRRFAQEHAGHGLMLIRNKLADLEAAGITRIGRVQEVRGGRPVTEDGTEPPVTNIVWCTGSVPDHRFLRLPVFDERGRPRQYRGVSTEPGLYFIGLEFMFAVASSTLQGMDRDARYLTRHLVRRVRSAALR